MARLTGSVLGNLSGKLGNLSARTRNGKTYFAARPGPRTGIPTPAALAIRQKFAITIAIVKSVLELPALKAIWKEAKDPNISAANTIFRDNFALVNTDRPTDQNIITPGGFDFEIPDPLVSEAGITGNLVALNTVADISADEVDVDILAVVCYYNPVDPADLPYRLINLSQTEAGFDFANPYALDLAYNSYQQATAAKYQNSVIYLAIATKNAEGKVIQYSSTWAIEP